MFPTTHTNTHTRDTSSRHAWLSSFADGMEMKVGRHTHSKFFFVVWSSFLWHVFNTSPPLSYLIMECVRVFFLSERMERALCCRWVAVGVATPSQGLPHPHTPVTRRSHCIVFEWMQMMGSTWVFSCAFCD